MPPARGTVLGFLLVALGALSSTTAPAAPDHVIVDAGPHPRSHTLVSIPWPHPGPAPELVSRAGHGVPTQISSGRLWFIEPDLQPGESRRYQVRVASPALAPRPIVARRDSGRLDILLRGRLVARYLAGPGQLPRTDIAPEFLRGGYVHPFLTPSELPVTDDYPPNHIHQHGLWFSWTKTRFEGRTPDFWNMGQKSGRTDFEGLDAIESGPVFAGFTSRQVLTDLLVQPPKAALRETWTVRVPDPGPGRPYHLLDLESAQRCAGEVPLELPLYHYGGFAFRGLWNWNGPTQVSYLDSLGQTDRVKANATRPNWYWMGGPSAGPGSPVVGVVSFSHPTNFRSPQPLRVHPTEPYTCWSPSQLGDWAMRPGETYVSRYRVLALDGTPDPAMIERLWTDYATPPEVRVED